MRALFAVALLLTLSGAPGAAKSEGSAMQVSSSAFANGSPIPPRYSASGGNHSPPLNWTATPGAHAYALAVRDPDAPSGTFTHWVVWNIPAGTTGMPEDGLAGVVLGKNDAGSVGYFGPQPPYGRHHYHFTVYALDAPLSLAAGADYDRMNAAMRGHVLAKGELVGTFAAR